MSGDIYIYIYLTLKIVIIVLASKYRYLNFQCHKYMYILEKYIYISF